MGYRMKQVSVTFAVTKLKTPSEPKSILEGCIWEHGKFD